MKTFRCPYCADSAGKHTSKLVLGEHEGFGDYYPATCPTCNTEFEIPADRVERS